MMTTLTRRQLLNQLHWRYATKQFDPDRKISPEDWATLEEALVLTPSSYGLQPWTFFVVEDRAIREKLVAASWGQRQVADASHFVAFAAKKDFGEADVEANLRRIAEVRGVPVGSLAPLREMLVGNLIRGMDAPTRRVWATKQVYIALGNLLNSAALLGIDACPMEGIVPGQYDDILGLGPKGLHAVVACALGFRAAADKYAGLPKVRFRKEDVLVHV